MMQFTRKIMIILAAGLVAVSCLSSCGLPQKVDYATDSTENYGVTATPNSSENWLMEEAFEAFFPQRLEPWFQNVRYHYQACDVTTSYAAEMFLEFTVETESQFLSCVETVAPLQYFSRFPYDDAYLEYVIDDVYKRNHSTGSTSNRYFEEADIQKVLIQPKEHRLVFVALRAIDTWISVDGLTTYFDRFSIDPMTYGVQSPDCEFYGLEYYGKTVNADKNAAKEVGRIFTDLFPEDPAASMDVILHHYKMVRSPESKHTAAVEITLVAFATDQTQLENAMRTVAPLEQYTQPQDRKDVLEYAIADQYELNADDTISEGRIAKVIVQPEQQRITYELLLVLEPDVVKTKELTTYFDLFAIDPAAYGQS